MQKLNLYILVSIALVNIIMTQSTVSAVDLGKQQKAIELKGQRGPMGPTGPRGRSGRKGRNGRNGTNGPQGVSGPQGLPGVPGAQGPQGLQGPTGDPGLQGLKGDTGDRGPQGFTGPKGDTGPVGNGILSNYASITMSQASTTSIPIDADDSIFLPGSSPETTVTILARGAISYGSDAAIQINHTGDYLFIYGVDIAQTTSDVALVQGNDIASATAVPGGIISNNNNVSDIYSNSIIVSATSGSKFYLKNVSGGQLNLKCGGSNAGNRLTVAYVTVIGLN